MYFIFSDIFLFTSFFGKPVGSFVYVSSLLCWRGNIYFDVHFERVRPIPSPWKDGKNAVYEGRNGRRGVFFLPESAFFLRR